MCRLCTAFLKLEGSLKRALISEIMLTPFVNYGAHVDDVKQL